LLQVEEYGEGQAWASGSSKRQKANHKEAPGINKESSKRFWNLALALGASLVVVICLL
jgi:hypothetical protein